jgi:hypothetical protein
MANLRFALQEIIYKLTGGTPNERSFGVVVIDKIRYYNYCRF